MREFRARWRSAKAIVLFVCFFFFYAVLLVALVWLCNSVAVKCGKANKSSRKCSGKMYFLSKELARAAELQEASTICRVHWDEIRRSNNRCSVHRENHCRCLSEFLWDFFLSWMPWEQHFMSKLPMELLLSGSFYLSFHSLLFTEGKLLMHVHSLLYCWPNFIFSIRLLFLKQILVTSLKLDKSIC